MSTKMEITNSLARSIWAMYWADEIEDQGGIIGQVDILQEAPPTPKAAKELARDWVKAFENANDIKIERAYKKIEGVVSPEDFGHGLALEMSGADSWFDGYDIRHSWKIPSKEARLNVRVDASRYQDNPGHVADYTIQMWEDNIGRGRPSWTGYVSDLREVDADSFEEYFMDLFDDPMNHGETRKYNLGAYGYYTIRRN